MSRRPHTPQSIAALLVIALLAVVGPQFFRHPRATRTPENLPPLTTAPLDVDAAAPANIGSDVAFRSRATLEEHFRKHGNEFGQGTTIDAYLRAAQALRDAPAGSAILQHKRADGVTTRFDQRTGAFIAYNADATIRTFRPTDGERYFHRQAERPED